jgi:hypothetical protein
MKTIVARAALACVLAASAAACGGNGAASAGATHDAGPSDHGPVEALPLVQGYYVASDTACGEASNATLALLRGDGISACDFVRIERIDGSRYRTWQGCVDHQGPQPETFELVQDIEILGEDRYRVSDESGWEAEFRHCPQSTLPEFWRDVDLSEDG